MTASHAFTKHRSSPHQVRMQASLAIRNRVRGALEAAAPLRKPDADETPLSAAEVEQGRRLGLIRRFGAGA